MAKPATTGTVFHGGVLDYAKAREGRVFSRRRDIDPDIELPPSLPAQLSMHHGRLSNGAVHALPTEKVLLRVFDFPTSEEEEIESMVENEMYEAVPFPIEHMEVRHEILSKSDESSKVLACAVQRSLLDSLGNHYDAAGIKLKGVDVEVLGWIELLRHNKKLPGAGRHLVMFKDPAGTELVMLEDDVPIGFRSLGIHNVEEEETEEEFIDEITEELEYSLTALEGEWGSDPIKSLTVWHYDGVPDGLGRWGNICGLVPHTENFDSIGRLSEGVAIRAARNETRGQGGLDLTPDDWRETEENRRNLRNALWTVFGILSLWALVMAGIWGANKWQERRANQIEAEVAVQVDGPLAEYKELAANTKFLKAFNDRRYSAIDSLVSVNTNFASNGGVKVEEISYVKGDKMTFKGSAEQGRLVTDWVAKLRKNTTFNVDDPKLTAAGSRSTMGPKAQNFSFSFEFPDDSTASKEVTQ